MTAGCVDVSVIQSSTTHLTEKTSEGLRGLSTVHVMSDECHHISAFHLVRKLMRQVKAKYVVVLIDRPSDTEGWPTSDLLTMPFSRAVQDERLDDD